MGQLKTMEQKIRDCLNQWYLLPKGGFYPPLTTSEWREMVIKRLLKIIDESK